MKRDAAFWVWLFLLLLALVSAGALLTLGFVPFETLKSAGDRLAQDGSLERLTPALYSAAHLPARFLGILLLAGAAGWAIWLGWALRLLAAFGRSARNVGQDLRSGWRVLLADFRAGFPPRSELLVLVAILLLAGFVRVVLVQRAMEYDESYTFTEFARHSFREIVTDYHVRNNHVFHTLLVRAAYLLFGNAPWVVRLPALIAGLWLIPAVYVLGRRIYNASTGLLAAGGVAVFPILAVYSVNARGYTLLSLFALLLIFLADYVREKPNLAAWALMAVVTALGMYTIPIMLYPFGIVVSWLLLNGLSGKIHPGYGGKRRWTAVLMAFCVAAGTLTLLLYAPILSIYGFWGVLQDNPTYESQTLSVFFQQLPGQFAYGKGELLYGGLTDGVLWLLAGGSLLSLALHARISRGEVPLQLAAVLTLVPMHLVQRPVFITRVWLYFLVLMILWTSAALAGIPRLLPLSEGWRQRLRMGTAGLLLVAVLAGGMRFLAPYLANPSLLRYPYGMDAELVTRYFLEHLQEDDIVVMTNEEDAPYWYYFTYYQIPDARIRSVKTRPFRRAFVITHPDTLWTVDNILTNFGPDLWFVRMETLHLETQIGNTLIYSLQPNQAAIDQEFGLQAPK